MTSILAKACLSGALLLGTGAAKLVVDHFPPEGEIIQIGEKRMIEKVERVFLGYRGSDDHILDSSKEIYIGSKKEAQFYAEMRAKGGGRHPDGRPINAVVHQIWADKMPTFKHLGISRFHEGPEPISPKGQQELNITAINPEYVTLATQQGITGAVRRAICHLKNTTI
ncbi:MAG: hypothetical protein A3G30_05600 [Chlamydiae bacterium RIFCSPLOWO2_12_FULL_49_12]|nr:MAG: hypothetical protein A2098_01700 [Chlamydiae bacterium GWF2_49_8]OGN63421.1 MAG: hypothetical protein A3E26_00565 [Chlamydiae bacterium RIFCSPHIGHO2_12_FULL_49_32]OGN69575.1 MAG: hypothetical protein A3I15_00515 [Chlamydiae bacterium RIFCSPLOWO2_02_FULL_49_12]OGN72366.1 MAG: hypothetical protein A3G30_05600 [Chlamydiae bacterium RIFCSPLOWO2_12_FULL_49_12]